jgi:heparan-alpha-glucosaminide N-acetyltransferase
MTIEPIANDAMTPIELPKPAVGRLASIDALRGLVMLMMLGEVLAFWKMAETFPDSSFWAAMKFQQSHVEWVTCILPDPVQMIFSAHDLIQPSFSFLVGAAMAFSLASRKARGQSTRAMTLHALWRSLVLIFLGIFLRSMGHSQTYFTFEDTLTQIGLGYFFLYLLGLRSPRVQWIALLLILVGYWAAFALYPLPGADFNWEQAGMTANWPNNLTGFAAHWNKNTNLAWAFDTWFLNLFPREHAFTNNGGGYSTLSFIPTLGTMVLGLIAGGWLRSDLSKGHKWLRLVLAGILLLTAGEALGYFGICPVVKRIWTPSWVLFSGGCALILLAFFYLVMDIVRFKVWAFPLLVVGANSIVAYCSEWFCIGFLRDSLHIHLGKDYFTHLAGPYASLCEGGAILLIIWLILLWMYRNKIFVKI